MSVLLAILLLFLAPAVMLVLHRVRRVVRFLWLIALLGVLFAWPLVYAARSSLPVTIAPQTWQPVDLFPLSPALLVDTSSWLLALALVTNALAVMLTSVARLGGQVIFPSEPSPGVEAGEKDTAPDQPLSAGANWRAWAANLALTGLGLVAVLAGNLLTLALAWAALDVLEILILLGQVSTGDERSRVVRAFSARVSGIAALLLAGVIIWAQGGQLEYSILSTPVVLFFLIASGLRLGILPVNVPVLRELPLRIGLGTTLRLVPVAASLVLLVRSADTGIPGIIGLALLAMTALAGLVGGIGWLRAPEALEGRSYWILGTTSLALAAAILGQPAACLAWSLAILLPGSLIFLSWLRRRFITPILLLGFLGFSGLPYTPAWAESSIFQSASGFQGVASQVISLLLGILFFITHAILLGGYLVHSLRDIRSSVPEAEVRVDRWIWLLYIPGLLVLPLFHFISSWIIRHAAIQITMVMWLEGVSALCLAGAIWLYTSRPGWLKQKFLTSKPWLSSGQVYQPLYQPFAWLLRLVAQIIRVISTVLEGEAGLLWAFVLLVLGLVFLQR